MINRGRFESPALNALRIGRQDRRFPTIKKDKQKADYVVNPTKKENLDISSVPAHDKEGDCTKAD